MTAALLAAATDGARVGIAWRELGWVRRCTLRVLAPDLAHAAAAASRSAARVERYDTAEPKPWKLSARSMLS